MASSGPCGTTIARSLAFGAGTPWNRIRCSLGRETILRVEAHLVSEDDASAAGSAGAVGELGNTMFDRMNCSQWARFGLTCSACQPFEDGAQIDAVVEEVLHLAEVSMGVLAEPEGTVRASQMPGASMACRRCQGRRQPGAPITPAETASATGPVIYAMRRRATTPD